MYPIKLLQENFEKGSDGRTPEEFIKQTANNCLDNWINSEQGAGNYRLTGEYWESLLPVLQKYAPEKLAVYESLVPEPFTTFNEQVKEVFNYGNDLYNLLGALQRQSDSTSV